MADAHENQLIKMAQQIALNMAAEGDAQAGKTAAHIKKFWTPAMRQRLIDHVRKTSTDVPPAVALAVDILAEAS